MPVQPCAGEMCRKTCAVHNHLAGLTVLISVDGIHQGRCRRLGVQEGNRGQRGQPRGGAWQRNMIVWVKETANRPISRGSASDSGNTSKAAVS